RTTCGASAAATSEIVATARTAPVIKLLSIKSSRIARLSHRQATACNRQCTYFRSFGKGWSAILVSWNRRNTPLRPLSGLFTPRFRILSQHPGNTKFYCISQIGVSFAWLGTLGDKCSRTRACEREAALYAGGALLLGSVQSYAGPLTQIAPLPGVNSDLNTDYTNGSNYPQGGNLSVGGITFTLTTGIGPTRNVDTFVIQDPTFPGIGGSNP